MAASRAGPGMRAGALTRECVGLLPARDEGLSCKIWWPWGMRLAWATVALILGAEALREEGHRAAGDLLDVARFAIYWIWCRPAWRACGDARNPVWIALARTALAAGLAITVLI